MPKIYPKYTQKHTQIFKNNKTLLYTREIQESTITITKPYSLLCCYSNCTVYCVLCTVLYPNCTVTYQYTKIPQSKESKFNLKVSPSSVARSFPPSLTVFYATTTACKNGVTTA